MNLTKMTKKEMEELYKNLKKKITDEKIFNKFSLKLEHNNPLCYEDEFYKNKYIQKEFKIVNVDYIKNTPNKYKNPFFPTIHIYTLKNLKNIKWLQFIKVGKNNFIDTLDFCFPFYPCSNDFWDAPHWGSIFFEPPFKKWIAHCYLIQLDNKNKTIKFITGIQWGYLLIKFVYLPKCIEPILINKKDFKLDWKNRYEIWKNTICNFGLQPTSSTIFDYKII